VSKPLRDTQLAEGSAHRDRCGRTFRVSPTGSATTRRARLKGLAVPFAVLGMSYGAVTAALVALGWPLSKVAVSYAVQALGGIGRRDRGRDQQRR
jgi:hypothetical protein